MRRIAASCVLLAACVLGFRGEASIEGDHALDGVHTVHIELPSTPLSVVTCDPEALTGCPERLRYEGRVLATGGSGKDAERHAGRLALQFERSEGLGLLRADVPVDVRGLVDLELERIELPSDRDLELETDRGDVDIVGPRGAIAIRLGTGDVVVHGGDGGVAADVSLGNIEVTTEGDVDLRSDRGEVTVMQTGGPRHVVITTGRGAVHVELASSADLTLEIDADGTIDVTTDTVVARTRDRLRRRTGNGTLQISIDAGGPVEITQRR